LENDIIISYLLNNSTSLLVYRRRKMVHCTYPMY